MSKFRPVWSPFICDYQSTFDTQKFKFWDPAFCRKKKLFFLVLTSTYFGLSNYRWTDNKYKFEMSFRQGQFHKLNSTCIF
jgi:hypothetical protein